MEHNDDENAAISFVCLVDWLNIFSNGFGP